MDRGVLFQPVGDVQQHILPLAQTDQRAGDRAVDGDGMGGTATGTEMMIGYVQPDILTPQLAKAAPGLCHRCAACPGRNGQGGCCRQRRRAADKTAAGEDGICHGLATCRYDPMRASVYTPWGY